MATPIPLIAILTDFGQSDWYVASMKGVISRIAPNARFVDITHDIEDGNVRSGAFILSQCYEDFPEGSIFLCVVDPGVGSSRKPIILYTGDYYFVAPDNGLLAMLKPTLSRAFEIDPRRFPVKAKSSSTFHGRDIFAPAAAYLASGNLTPSDIAQPLPGLNYGGYEREPVATLPTKGEIVYFDKFGNAISDLYLNELSPLPDEIVLKNGISVPFRKTFSDVPPGEAVAYLGSGSRLEIAINQGCARITLNLERDSDFIAR
ncbi:SAM-dependent chlorinase/fluorinase [Pelagicoccus sp. SDUM812003]|uniref:SAM hydrolase/SAM-dependent halogenase family protein n=1 Tax=Pelagicoccus sp. SDUM812003 TaxID=3041267 RepID=UPI00280DC2FF|nr:SAM-dependent chlorinase/fluorinase [Pelagicoccus sp. SDUM812003]MDQ8203188.1 SAM-dependent chlorinase/fluorinase [Pelagicoccus sp. SDUM812003]